MNVASRTLAIAAAATAIAAAGGLATAAPASAALSDCPNNNVCLWAGSNGTGALLFIGNGTTMHDNGGFFDSAALEAHPIAFSASNRTLGRFCTYNADKSSVTNILNAQTSGNLASHTARWVKIC